jgi:hypothetical protein
VRPHLPFSAVNRTGTPQYDPTLQRHHLLPRQLLSLPCFRAMFAALGYEGIGFDDFRRNGLLLPAREEAVRRLALPLHRGPHRDYNAMVIDKVGGIEGRWAQARKRCPDAAGWEALGNLARLQGELRLGLLNEREPFRLNRRDPLMRQVDFTCLDTLAEELWRMVQGDFEPDGIIRRPGNHGKTRN